MKLLTRKLVLLVLVVIVLLAAWILYSQVTKTAKTVEYEAIYIEDAPAQIYAQYDKQKTKTGFSVNYYDGAQYILITTGPEKTGGFDLEINEVTKRGGKWVIKASLLPPDPDSFVTQAISYPAIVVKLPHTATNVEVLVDGKAYLQM